MLIPDLALILAESDQSEGLGFKFVVGIIGGLIGVGGVVLGFLLNQYHQESKERIKELNEYIAALQSAANELDFYRAKLTQLSGELEAIAAKASSWRADWIIPTYSIYPSFLEKCKITINAFQRNAYLVKEIGHCHFELCHILERMNVLKHDLRTELSTDARILTEQLKTHFGNAKGFKGLVDSNIPVFKAASEAILAEKTKMDEELRLQKERSLISRLAE